MFIGTVWNKNSLYATKSLNIMLKSLKLMRFIYVSFEYDLEFATYQLQWAAVVTEHYYNNTTIPQGDQKVYVHLMITIQKVTSNVQSILRQSPDI
jgi:hypothetical protein